MRYVILFLFLSIPAFAQKKTYRLDELLPIDSLTGEITYQGVVQVPNASAADLYSRAKTYYLKTFNNANAVIQADEVGKRVSGKGIFAIRSRTKGLFSGPQEYMVTVDIQVKDGRYRYEFSQFALHVTYPRVQNIPLTDAYKRKRNGFNENEAEQLRVWDEDVVSYVSSLYKYMTSAIGSKDF